jgi:hypothetical protein
MKTKLSRRAALAGALATAPAAAATALPAAIGADAELIALHKQLLEAWAHQKATEDDDSDDAYYDTSDIVAEIEAAPAANSIAGLAARARAFLWCAGEEQENGDPFGYYETTDHRLLRLLFRDLLRLNGDEVPAWAMSNARTTAAEFIDRKTGRNAEHRFPDLAEQMDMLRASEAVS